MSCVMKGLLENCGIEDYDDPKIGWPVSAKFVGNYPNFGLEEKLNIAALFLGGGFPNFS